MCPRKMVEYDCVATIGDAEPDVERGAVPAPKAGRPSCRRREVNRSRLDASVPATPPGRQLAAVRHSQYSSRFIPLHLLALRSGECTSYLSAGHGHDPARPNLESPAI